MPLFDFIRKYRMKLKLESVDYIIGLMTDRIMDKKYLVLVCNDGTLQTFYFCDETGELDQDMVTGFLEEIRENAEDMLTSGVMSDPEDAVSLTLTSFAGTATYNKVGGSDPSASYIR